MSFSDMNLLDVLPQSTAVDFFQGYPRLVGGNVFAVNREYFVGVAVAGAVYIVTGGVIGLVLLLVTFGSCCCCDGSPVFSSHKWNRTAGRRRAGVVLSGGMTVVAQGMLALVVITFSALSLTVNQMRDVLQFAWRGVGGLVNYGADVVLTLQQIIAAFPEDFISDKYKPDFKNLQNELSSSLPDVNNARNVIQGYVNLAENIATRVDDAKSIVVVVVAVILLVFAFCMALSYYGTAEKKFVRIGVRILLLYPVLMSWLLMGVSISTGVVTGDACRVLDEYHQYLIAVSKGSSPQYTGDNILVTSGFNCPTQMYPQEIRQLNTSLGLLSKYPGVAALILNSSEPKIYRATASLTNVTSSLVDCSVILEISGHTQFKACGNYSMSIASIARTLFISSVFLAFVTLALFVFTVLGLPIPFFTVAWLWFSEEDSDGEYEEFVDYDPGAK